MASPLKIIKDGIKNQDWSTVCRGYNLLTGEKINVANESEVKDHRKVLEAIAKAALGALDQLPEEESEELPKKVATAAKRRGRPPGKTVAKTAKKDDSEADAGVDQIPMMGGNVTMRGFAKLTDNLTDPKAEKVNKILMRKGPKDKRDPVRKIIKKCSSCSNDFDFVKAYPAGKFDTSCDILKCSTCQAKAR